MKHTLLLLTLCTALFAVGTARAQDYGTGTVLDVPRAPAGVLTIDGVADEPIWDTAAMLDILTETNFYAQVDTADVTADARVLYGTDTVYVYVRIFGDSEFYWGEEGNPWQGDQILIGVDPTHAGDDQLDEDFAGWPANAPDQGPYALKIWRDGITLNWGYDEVDPEAEGWVNGTVVVDEETGEWGVEAAIYVPTAEPGAQIGFNAGGANANAAQAGEAEGDGTYGYFSWQVGAEGCGLTDPANCVLPGSNIMNNAGSFATLNLVGGDGGGEGYGTGEIVQVLPAEPGSIVYDGVADEAAWENATEVDMLANADFFALVEEPDLAAETKLLWSDDTLYVYARIFDNDLNWGSEPGSGSDADQILLGIDPTHMGDSLYDGGFGGFPEHAPDAGPYAYKVYNEGITLDWGSAGIFPMDSMWVNGTVFVDEETFEWGIEAAFYVPQIEENAEIGFNIGGAQASQEACDNEGECTYGFFSWQVCEISGEFCSFAGGAVMSDARSFATLHLVTELITGVEEARDDAVPSRFTLRQNYPNPFNPTTTIEYGVAASGRVALDVYDMLGRRVATLIDAVRAPGTYRVQWDAADLPSGAYFYQLRVDGKLMQTKSMMLVK